MGAGLDEFADCVQVVYKLISLVFYLIYAAIYGPKPYSIYLGIVFHIDN